MFSGKEGMATDLASVLEQIQCRVMVLRASGDPDPAILVVFAQGRQPVVTIEEFDAGRFPDEALAVVDVRGDPVMVMISKHADTALRETLQGAVLDSLRANAQIGRVMHGTIVASEADGKALN